MNPRVKHVQILDNYKLLLTFTNDEKKVFDVKPYLSIGIFKELKNADVFNSVKIIDGTIQWLNDADFCPDTLYLESQVPS
jgi:Protein of unknown function (DUF2442)